MGEARRKRKKAKPGLLDKPDSTPYVDVRLDGNLPIAEEGAITETTVYPTIEAMFTEAIAKMPWYPQYSPGTQRTIKFAFYTAIAETLRTVAFRMNADQNDSVFDDFGRELTAYDAELLRAVRNADSELH